MSMRSTSAWLAASLLTLLTLGGCGTSVTVVHTIPPEYNLAPAKTVAVFGTGRDGEGYFVDLFISALRSRATYQVIDARAFLAKIDSAETDDLEWWHSNDPQSFELFRSQSPADVIVQVFVSPDYCTETETEIVKDYYSYHVDCEATLLLIDGKDGHRIGVVDGVGSCCWGSANRDIAWGNAESQTAWNLVNGFTPLPIAENIDIDKQAPLAKEGIAKLDRGDLAGARSLWEEGLTRSAGSAALLYNLGAVCEALRDLDAARRYYTEAGALAPTEPKYQQALTLLETRSRDAKVAKEGEPAEVAAARAKAAADAEAAAKAATKQVDDEKTRAARERKILIGKEPLHEEKSGVILLRIPAGRFTMGCTTGDKACSDVEQPAHLVTISRPFYLAYELTTNFQYQRCVDAGACRGKADMAKASHPVVNVDWSDAGAFCSWIGGRLPTEAEWEYAARGGTEGWRYPWGNEISHDNANFAEATKGGNVEVQTVKAGDDLARVFGLTYPYNGTSPVLTFLDNGFGLLDMAGNVLQWTNDWDGAYQEGPATDPAGPAKATVRVLRGGSWAVTGGAVRVSSRYSYEPAAAADTIGFRCAIDAGSS